MIFVTQKYIINLKKVLFSLKKGSNVSDFLSFAISKMSFGTYTETMLKVFYKLLTFSEKRLTVSIKSLGTF